jgi:hypothetical protein
MLSHITAGWVANERQAAVSPAMAELHPTLSSGRSGGSPQRPCSTRAGTSRRVRTRSSTPLRNTSADSRRGWLQLQQLASAQGMARVNMPLDNDATFLTYPLVTRVGLRRVAGGLLHWLAHLSRQCLPARRPSTPAFVRFTLGETRQLSRSPARGLTRTSHNPCGGDIGRKTVEPVAGSCAARTAPPRHRTSTQDQPTTNPIGLSHCLGSRVSD